MEDNSTGMSNITEEKGCLPEEGNKATTRTFMQQNHFHRLLKTLLINVSFVAMGLAESIKGPTLLDLKDLFHTSLTMITYLFIVRSIGSIAGAFSAGLLLEKFPQYHFFLLFGWTAIIGIGNLLLPFTGSLPIFFLCCAVLGWSTGSLDTGGNKLCLDVWKGTENGGPYMHSIHFAFAIGCFIAPVIAEPFLSNKRLTPEDANTTIFHNMTLTVNETDIDYSIEDSDTSGMTTLYPIVGVFIIFTSIGYLIYGFRECRNLETASKSTTSVASQTLNGNKHKGHKQNDLLKLWLVILLVAFIFLYVGMEVMYGTFVATFSVKSNLRLSRQEGAKITSIFWGSFAAMRFSAILISIKLSALSQMILSFTLCVIGSISLVIAGDVYKYVLCVASGLMGAGMASVYACGILWIEQHITVTNKIMSSMIISGSIGADLFPIILGQFMATFPMILMYLQVAVVFMCILLFSTSYLITRLIKKNESNGDSCQDEELEHMKC